MVFEGLTAEVSADSADFVAGVRGAKRSLASLGGAANELARDMTFLSGRADEAGDEIAQTGRRAAVTSGLFASLSLSTSGLSASFGTLSTAATASLIPALVTLSSVLVPIGAILGTVTAGAGALAGAFGAVVGSGILAFGSNRAAQARQRLGQINEQIDRLEALRETEEGLTESQDDRLEQLKERQSTLEEQTSTMGALADVMKDLLSKIKDVVTEWGAEFIPLIEDTLDAIPDLVENIFHAMGGLEVFADALRDFGRAAFRTIPRVTAFMFDLARRALPIARDFFGWMLRNGRGIFMGMLRTTERLAPVFQGLLDAIIDIMPEINELGTRILGVAVPAVESLVRFLEDVLQLGLGSDSFVGFIRNAIGALVEWVQGPGKQQIQGVIQSIKDAFTALLGGGEDDTLFSAFTSFVAGVLDSVASWMTSGGQAKIRATLTSLFGAMADVLTGSSNAFADKVFQPLQTILAGLFDAITGALQSEEAGALGTAIGNTAGAIMRLFADEMIEYARSDAFVEDLQGLTLAVSNSIGRALMAGGRSALGIEEGEGLGAQTGFGARAAGSDGTFPVFRQSEAFWRRRGMLPSQQSSDQGRAPTGPLEIRVTGELRDENGEITARIDDRVETRVDRESNSVHRRRGMPGTR